MLLCLSSLIIVSHSGYRYYAHLLTKLHIIIISYVGIYHSKRFLLGSIIMLIMHVLPKTTFTQIIGYNIFIYFGRFILGSIIIMLIMLVFTQHLVYTNNRLKIDLFQSSILLFSIKIYF